MPPHNFCIAPSSTFAPPGVTEIAISLASVICDEPDLLVFAVLVAVICTVAFAGKSPGAMYTPLAEIIPSVLFPPGTPFTLEVTLAFVVFETSAVKFWLFPKGLFPTRGATSTTMEEVVAAEAEQVLRLPLRSPRS
jgi:hypothetical protein